MKRNLIILFLIISIFSCNVQKVGEGRIVIENLDFIEIKIDDGYAKYGMNSIHLTVDGLIYRNFTEIKFVAMNEIELKSLLKLQNFIEKNNMLYNNYKLSDSIEIVSSSSPQRIVLNNLKGNINYIEYKLFNSEIKKVKRLLINLVPEEFRYKYKFFGF